MEAVHRMAEEAAKMNAHEHHAANQQALSIERLRVANARLRQERDALADRNRELEEKVKELAAMCRRGGSHP